MMKQEIKRAAGDTGEDVEMAPDHPSKKKMAPDLKAKGTSDAFVLSEELYGAAKLMQQSVSQIEVLQERG